MNHLSATASILLLIVLIVFYVAFVEPHVEKWGHRRYRRKMENVKRSWRLYATGGGHIDIHETRTKALAVCQEKFGTVLFVDDEHGFIFYKPVGYVRTPDSFC